MSALRGVDELTLARAREMVDAVLNAQDPPLWMYAIQAGFHGSIKLGISRDPAKRLRELQGSNPEPLELIATWRSLPLEEKQIHEEFSHRRIRGEWFSYDPEILRYVLGLEISRSHLQ